MQKTKIMEYNYTPNDSNIDFSRIYNSIFKVEINDIVLSELEYIYNEYLEYIDLYNEIPWNKRVDYRKAIMYDELFFLHSMELKDSDKKIFLERFVDDNFTKNSIGYISSKTDKYDINSFKHMHKNIMMGYDYALEDIQFRTNEDIFVGHILNDNDKKYYGLDMDKNYKYVDYFPPKAKDMEENLDMIFTLTNDLDLISKNPNSYSSIKAKDFDKMYALFIMPLFVGALIPILQPFNDGNSRSARCFNAAQILKLTNIIFETKYKLPILYLSKGYYPYLNQYRNLIANIANEPNSENWNKWLLFGLHSINDYIQYSRDNLEKNNIVKTKKLVRN